MSDIEAKNLEHAIVDKTVRTVPDFPKPGIQFKDITPMVGDPEAFNYVIQHLADRYKGKGVTKVVGLESRGFFFACPLAIAIGASFAPARKPNKLPAEKISQTYKLEYGEDQVQMHVDSISKGDKVLVIDDLIATGGTLTAGCQLVERLGGEVVEAICIIELPNLGGRKHLLENGIKAPLYSMLCYNVD